MEISASHSLKLSYRSKCENLHGHNWIITVYCRSEVLNEDGMVVDFTHIKETVMGRLDHRNLNEVVSFNPTAENIARWVCEQQRNKKILDGVRAATFKPLIECLKSIDQDLLKGAVAGAKFSELFFASCKDEELAAYVKTLL